MCELGTINIPTGLAIKNKATANILSNAFDDKKIFTEYFLSNEIYHNLLNNIKLYNRADTVNMSEKEMNKFRHIAGPAYLVNCYYSKDKVNRLGLVKEFKDVIQGRGISDTIYDWANNQKGINIGLKTRGLNLSQKDLFDYIFQTEIKPYRKQY